MITVLLTVAKEEFYEEEKNCSAVTNVNVTVVNKEREEEKSKKLFDVLVKTVGLWPAVKDICKTLYPVAVKAGMLFKNMLFVVLSCFAPGRYIPNIPPVREYQEQTITLSHPGNVLLVGVDGQTISLPVKE